MLPCVAEPLQVERHRPSLQFADRASRSGRPSMTSAFQPSVVVVFGFEPIEDLQQFERLVNDVIWHFGVPPRELAVAR